MRSSGRRLARLVALARLVSPLLRWYPIAVFRRTAATAGPLPCGLGGRLLAGSHREPSAVVRGLILKRSFCCRPSCCCDGCDVVSARRMGVRRPTASGEFPSQFEVLAVGLRESVSQGPGLLAELFLQAGDLGGEGEDEVALAVLAGLRSGGWQVLAAETVPPDRTGLRWQQEPTRSGGPPRSLTIIGSVLEIS